MQSSTGGYATAFEVAGVSLPNHDATADPDENLRASLDRDIDAVLMESSGAISLDEIHEGVNARPGPHVPRGVIERRLAQDPDKYTRVGDKYVLAAVSRLEMEDPGKVVDRRTEILAALAAMTEAWQPAVNPAQGPPAEAVAHYVNEDKEHPTGVEVIGLDLERLADSGAVFIDVIDGEAHYCLSRGVYEEMVGIGAHALAARSIGGAQHTEDRTGFEAAANDAFDEERRGRLAAEAMLAKVRAHLDSKHLGFLIEQALGPISAPTPDRKTFDYLNAVVMDDRERAVLLREIRAIEEEIHEINAKVEGAKMAAATTKTAAKERLAELEDKKAQLFAEETATRRTYTTKAYAEFLVAGDDESGGRPVNLIRAVDDDRILKREVLSPAEALLAAAEAPTRLAPTPARPALPSPSPEPSSAPQEAPAGHTGIVLSFVRGRKQPSTVLDICKGVRLPPVHVKAALEILVSDGSVSADMSATTPTYSAAKPADKHDKAAKKAKAAKAEEAKGHNPKSKVTISVSGLRPYVLGALAAAGKGGLDEDIIFSAVADATGLERTSAFEMMVRSTLKQTKLEIDERDERFYYPMGKVLVDLVRDAGDSGILFADLFDRFTESTLIEVSGIVKMAILGALDEAVEAEEIRRGPMPDGSGDVLWLGSETDPRRLLGA